MSFILNDSGGKYVVNHRSSAKSYYSSSRVSVYEIIHGINEDEAFMLHNNSTNTLISYLNLKASIPTPYWT
jgi:hypothetical protein